MNSWLLDHISVPLRGKSASALKGPPASNQRTEGLVAGVEILLQSSDNAPPGFFPRPEWKELQSPYSKPSIRSLEPLCACQSYRCLACHKVDPSLRAKLSAWRSPLWQRSFNSFLNCNEIAIAHISLIVLYQEYVWIVLLAPCLVSQCSL